VAGLRDRVLGNLRDVVGIREPARSETLQQVFERVRIKADQAKVEIGKPERLELVARQIGIPFRPRRQLIIGQAVGSLFLLAPAARDDHRDLRYRCSWSSAETAGTGN